MRILLYTLDVNTLEKDWLFLWLAQTLFILFADGCHVNVHCAPVALSTDTLIQFLLIIS